MGTTATVMGFVGGAYGFTQFLLRIPMGIGADIWQKKFFISFGCLCTALAALCMLIFHNPVGFLAGRALGGVAASSWVPLSVLFSSYYKPEQATRSITLINLANQIGRLSAFFIAGLLAANFSIQSVFVLSAVGGFVGFIISLFAYEDKSSKEKKATSFRELISAGKERSVLVPSILSVFVQVIAFATFTTFAANHAVTLGATAMELGNLHVALLLPSILLSALLSKYILLKVNAKHLVVLGFIITAIYCVAVPFTTTIPQLYIAQAVGGMGNTLTFSLLMGLSVQNIATEKRGAAMGFHQAIYGIGMTVGPLIMGFLMDFMGLGFGFFTMAGLAVLSALGAVVFLRGANPRN